MNNTSKTNTAPSSGSGIKLPKILWRYGDADFALQQKARFMYYLCLILIGALLLIITYTGTFQIASPAYQGLYFPVLIPELGLLLVVTLTVILLIKGYYHFSSHFIFISSLLTAWVVIWLGHSEDIPRLDTIVMVPAMLSLLPILITRQKRTILWYIAANIGALYIFLFLIKDQLNVSDSGFYDYLSDNTIAILFTGIIGYLIFEINQKNLKKTIADFEERQKSEQALLAIEKKFNEVTDLLPQTVFESDLSGKLTYVNANGIKQFGYSTEDFLKGINVLEFIHEKDKKRALDNFNATVSKTGKQGNLYTAIRKDGTTFQIQIYSDRIEENDIPKGIRGIAIDITDQVKAEKALIDSEQKYRTLIENINEAIMMVDNEDKVQFINKRFSELLEYLPEEIMGKPGFIMLADPEDEGRIKRDEQKRTSTTFNQYELTFKSKSGKILNCLVSASPLVNVEGLTEGTIIALVDITERKQAQEYIAKSEKRFRDLAALLPQTVWESDIRGKITFINQHGIDLFGYTQNEIEQELELVSTLTPEDQIRARLSIQKRLNGEIPSFQEEEYTAVKKDGTPFPIQVYSSTIYENKKPVGLRGITIDMTEIKKAESELRHSEERYRTIIDAFPDLIMLSDLKGNILFGNEPFKQITGIGEEDYQNPNRVAQIHPDDKQFIREAIEGLMSGKNKFTPVIENRFIDKSGKLHWFSGTISKITLNNQVVLQTITRDVTEKKSIEQELENHREHLEILVNERTEDLAAANEELTSINEELHDQQRELETALKNLKEAQAKLIQAEKMASLGVLAAGVAHEINNPLNFINGGIIGLESYLNDHLKEHLSEVAPLIEGVQVGVKRASDIVASLNHYSRKNDLPNSPCNIESIIDHCLVMLQNQTKNRIEIVKTYTDEPYIVVANEGRLHQVFLNILLNSVQAIVNQGTIRIFTKIFKTRLMISISDTGTGIKQDVLSRITDPFFTTKDPGQGTGLGLSISYNILQEYKGTLEFESEFGKGTTVTITLPLQNN